MATAPAIADTAFGVTVLLLQVTVADKGVDPESLCLKSTVLSIEDPPNTKGWMTQDDWGAEFRAINHNQHPIIQVGVDGEGATA